MIRLLPISVLCLLCFSCNFDGDRQLALARPATIVVKNVSAEPFTIQEIYSTTASHGGFILKGGPLAPGQNLSHKVSESDYDIFVSKAYTIEVKCPNKEVLAVKGDTIDAEEKADWTLELFLNTCSQARF
jgi:hypothetical protein